MENKNYANLIVYVLQQYEHLPQKHINGTFYSGLHQRFKIVDVFVGKEEDRGKLFRNTDVGWEREERLQCRTSYEINEWKTVEEFINLFDKYSKVKSYEGDKETYIREEVYENLKRRELYQEFSVDAMLKLWDLYKKLKKEIYGIIEFES